MVEIFNKENMIVDYFEASDEYRISLFDANGHYTDEFFLTKLQMADLKDGLKDLEIEIEDTL